MSGPADAHGARFWLYLTALAVHPALTARRRVFLKRSTRREGEGLAQYPAPRTTTTRPSVLEAQEFVRVKVDKDLRQFGTALGLNPDIHYLFSRSVVS